MTAIHDETKHPRAADGKWATKGFSEAADGTSADLSAGWSDGSCLSCSSPADGELCAACIVADDPMATERGSDQGLLPIDVSDLPRNPYGVDEVERFAYPLSPEQLVEADIQCPTCREYWGHGHRGTCTMCQDEDGRPREFYANPIFLRETFDPREYGAIGVPADQHERTFSENGGAIGHEDSVGADARVRTLYATNHPRAPYVERVVSWHVAAIGPDGRGGSQNWTRAQVAQVLDSGEELEDVDVDLEMRRNTHFKIRTSSDENLPAVVWLSPVEGPEPLRVDDLWQGVRGVKEEHDMTADDHWDQTTDDTFDIADFADRGMEFMDLT